MPQDLPSYGRSSIFVTVPQSDKQHLYTAPRGPGCDPGFFGPRMVSTRLGFSYARRRATTVNVLCGATRSYAQVIDTQGLLRTGLMSWFARGRRHGYDSASIREPAAAFFYDMRHTVAREAHAVARNRALTAAALGYAAGGPLDYGLSRAALAQAPDASALLLHATARPEKEWPEARWIALGCALVERGLTPLLLWGNEAERAGLSHPGGRRRADRGALPLVQPGVRGVREHRDRLLPCPQ